MVDGVSMRYADPIARFTICKGNPRRYQPFLAAGRAGVATVLRKMAIFVGRIMLNPRRTDGARYLP